MDQKDNQRKLVFGFLIFGTIFILFMIFVIWLSSGEWRSREGVVIELSLAMKVIITIGLLLLLLVSYWMYNHQKKLDMMKSQKKITGRLKNGDGR